MNLQRCIWLNEKPEFNEECVFVTATDFKNQTDYTVWQIEKCDGENEEGEDCWYWGLLNGDGEEYGALEDLVADRYFVLPKTKNHKP